MNKCAAFSSHLLLMFSIVLFAGKMDALKCYEGSSDYGYAERECPKDFVCIAGTRTLDLDHQTELTKMCAPDCEESLKNCHKCPEDLCNGDKDIKGLRCHYDMPEEKGKNNWMEGAKELVCPKDLKCIKATFDDGNTRILRGCGPNCDQIRKNFAMWANKDDLSAPILTDCQQCEDVDLCNAGLRPAMAGPLPMLLMIGILFISSVMWHLGLSGVGRK